MDSSVLACEALVIQNTTVLSTGFMKPLTAATTSQPFLFLFVIIVSTTHFATTYIQAPPWDLSDPLALVLTLLGFCLVVFFSSLRFWAMEALTVFSCCFFHCIQFSLLFSLKFLFLSLQFVLMVFQYSALGVFT